MGPGVSIVVGLVLLIVGAEFLVRGAAAIATSLGIPPLAIGLTVVAFGTGAPELTVSVVSALQGANDIAVGNVVGSNIFNVLFILGTCALILPLTVQLDLVRRDVPIMIGVSALMVLMIAGQTVTRLEGVVLTVALVLYTIWTIRSGRRDIGPTDSDIKERFHHKSRPPTGSLVSVAMVVVSLVTLVAGSRLFIDGAVGLARTIGVSNLVIGLTIVAAGTSLPEVATSIVATVRGERDIAVGNVVGSNIFNVLGVLGISAIVAPEPGIAVQYQSAMIDVPFMVIVALACLPVFVSGSVISRWEGALFLIYYIGFTIVLIALNKGSLTLQRPLLFVAALGLPLVIATVSSVVLNRKRARRSPVAD